MTQRQSEMPKERQYLVEWVIDIWADNPTEAAARALIVQRDPESTATVFKVHDGAGEMVQIDLSEEPGRIRCEGCGIPIPDVHEDADKAALLCDTCYSLTSKDEP